MVRPYKPEDRDQCLRILREVGWMEGKDTDPWVFDQYISDTTSFVTELDSEVEVLTLTRPGQVLYQKNDLQMSAVTGVLTSRVARMHGHALRTTAKAIAQSAEDGAVVTFLGIFDQGYYDKLGFGTLNYQRSITIDPAKLKVPKLSRSPKRLTKEDAEAIHNCRRKRYREHGGCNLDGVGNTACELVWIEHGFGLGFENDHGELTHFLWLKAKGAHGPYYCDCYAWQTPEQLVELLSVLRSLSDQVHGVRLCDPTGFQIQDFLDRPFASLRERKGGEFDSSQSANAWTQCRILDVESCVGAMKLCGDTVSFQLTLSDPISRYLPDACGWVDPSGSWVVTLGNKSSAVRGEDGSLPKLTCTINDFSRLWIGAASARALSVVGDLQADQELIECIDTVVDVPSPTTDWDV
ncbi:MAG: sterol carrier protein domain-containing protein [Phycisphaerales bacterium]|nr:sterol carrier protein domain-containing protein [Phycisphaerales bacterium]